MKITHIVFGLPVGGIETMLVNICKHQSESEHVSVIIINDLVNQSLLEALCRHARVYRLNRRLGSKSLIPVIKLNALLLAINPDIIHCHTTTISEVLIPRIFRKKCCVTMHGICSDKRSSRCLHNFDAIFSISETVQNSILETENLASVVVPNGVDFTQFKCNTDSHFHSKPRLIQVGRLISALKGQHVLIEAVSILKKNYGITVSVDFVGEGASLHDLLNLSRNLGIEDDVRFLGVLSQSELQQQLCRYDIFVQPSINEGFGLTVVEAIAARLAVLVSNIQGPYEIISQGKYGHSFRSEDPSDCAHMLATIINGGKDHRLISNAAQHCERIYGVSETAMRYLSEYRKLIRRNHPKMSPQTPSPFLSQ